MLEFFHEGGAAMYGVVLFGLVSLGAASAFAWRPDRRRIPLATWMGAATVLMGVAGTASGFRATFRHVARAVEAGQLKDEWPLVMCVGAGESLANTILAFSLAALTALVLGVGHRRLARLEAAAPAR